MERKITEMWTEHTKDVGVGVGVGDTDIQQSGAVRHTLVASPGTRRGRLSAQP